jgi:hypothetical protein
MRFISVNYRPPRVFFFFAIGQKEKRKIKNNHRLFSKKKKQPTPAEEATTMATQARAKSRRMVKTTTTTTTTPNAPFGRREMRAADGMRCGDGRDAPISAATATDAAISAETAAEALLLLGCAVERCSEDDIILLLPERELLSPSDNEVIILSDEEIVISSDSEPEFASRAQRDQPQPQPQPQPRPQPQSQPQPQPRPQICHACARQKETQPKAASSQASGKARRRANVSTCDVVGVGRIHVRGRECSLLDVYAAFESFIGQRINRRLKMRGASEVVVCTQKMRKYCLAVQREVDTRGYAIFRADFDRSAHMFGSPEAVAAVLVFKMLSPRMSEDRRHIPRHVYMKWGGAFLNDFCTHFGIDNQYSVFSYIKDTHRVRIHDIDEIYGKVADLVYCW